MKGQGPTIKVNGKEYPVRTAWWDHETGELGDVTYRDEDGQMITVYRHEQPNLDTMVRWPQQSMVLKGDAMMSNPNYKQSLKDFSAQVNPKPEGVADLWGTMKPGKQV